MAVFDFLRTKPGDLADLERQLARLLDEKAKVTAEVESYGTKRADLLLSSADDDAIVKFDADHAKASVRLERLEIGELALIERLDDLRARQSREAEALRREQSAADLTKRAVEIEKIVEILARQIDEFIAATPGDLVETHAYAELIGRGTKLTPTQVAAATLAQALFERLPDLFETVGKDGVGSFFAVSLPVKYLKPSHGISAELPKYGFDLRFAPFSGAADAILVAPLRGKARELRGSDDLAEAAE